MAKLLAVVVVAAALLCSPGLAAGASTITVQMTGAGTVQLASVTGAPARAGGCPEHAPLANPDTGPAITACTQEWAPTCSPAGGAASCDLRVRATPAVPGAPDL